MVSELSYTEIVQKWIRQATERRDVALAEVEAATKASEKVKPLAVAHRWQKTIEKYDGMLQALQSHQADQQADPFAVTSKSNTLDVEDPFA